MSLIPMGILQCTTFCHIKCCLLVLLVCLDACLRCQADNKQEDCVGKKHVFTDLYLFVYIYLNFKVILKK